MSKECENPRNPALVTCRNCEESKYLPVFRVAAIFMLTHPSGPLLQGLSSSTGL